MFWIMLILMTFVIPAIFCIHISMHWDYTMRPDDPVEFNENKMMLNYVTTIGTIFPHHNGFWDLKWSIIRHAFVFFVFSVSLNFYPSDTLIFSLPLLYLLYTILVLYRYCVRKSTLSRMKSEKYMDMWMFCRKLVRPCKSVLSYSVLCLIVLYSTLILNSGINLRPEAYALDTTVPDSIALSAPTKETIQEATHGLKQEERPLSGEKYISGSFDRDNGSKIIVNAGYNDCVVRLKDSDGAIVTTFYVRANETASVAVPASFFYVYFAEGETWYGWKDLFGPDTKYSRDPYLADLRNYEITYTMKMVQNGNLSLDSVNSSDFG